MNPVFLSFAAWHPIWYFIQQYIGFFKKNGGLVIPSSLFKRTKVYFIPNLLKRKLRWAVGVLRFQENVHYRFTLVFS